MAGARETYDAMGADYVAHVEANPYTALYEAPGLQALLPPVAGLRVAGVLVLSTHHPATHVELSDSGDYFALELRERFPEAWERLTTKPHFLFLRLVQPPTTCTGRRERD